jgi:hypothetical protein
MKTLAKSKADMQSKLLDLRYAGERAMTQRANQDMAMTAAAAEAEHNKKLRRNHKVKSAALRRASMHQVSEAIIMDYGM